MRRSARVVALSFAFCTDAAACAPESPRAAIIETLKGDPVRGRESFAAHCSSCHEAAGLSNIIGWYPRRAFLSIIVDGGKQMPSYATLSDQDIADIYAGLKEPAP